MNDFKIIRDDLISLGLSKGDSVLIHSSFKSMGEVDGGIQTLVDAISDCIGSSGTLLVPTLSYEYVPQDNPVYNHSETPSCVGAVSEFVRIMFGAKRSIHPTHSCTAIGDKRDFFVCGHENDCTPVGENSPFAKLPLVGGKVLMLGCFVGFNTSMHGVEEKFGTSYVLSETKITHKIILEDKTYEKGYHRHAILKNGFNQCYDRLENVMDMKKGIVHGAKSYLIDSETMWETAIEMLKKDELFFVERR